MHSSKPSVLLRHRLLVDQSVQGTLLRRTALYSSACAVYFVVILIFTESMTDPDQPITEAIIQCFSEAIYWAPGLLMMTPVVAYDLLNVSNRFAGPVFRLQREMRRLIDDESVEPLSFRDGDYWTELASTFNQIRDEMLKLREAQNDAPRERSHLEGVASRKQLFTSDTDDQESPDDFLVGSGF